MKFLRIILVVCLLLPANVFAASSETPSLLSAWEISQELSEIWELLNHQDFESAFIRQEQLLQYVNNEQIINDLSYADFLSVIGAYGIFAYYNDVEYAHKAHDLIEKRALEFPEEKKRCSFMTRWRGFTASCLVPWSRDDFGDKIGYLNRLIYRGNQRNTERYIALLQKAVNSPQDMSDLGNTIAFYVKQYPKREQYFSPIIRDLGQQIITIDPYWVNGYFLASQGLEPWSREALKLCDNLLLNYRGDDNRKRDSVDPFIKRMCLK